LFRISCHNSFGVRYAKGARSGLGWFNRDGGSQQHEPGEVHQRTVELRNDAPVGSVAFIRYNVLPVRDLATDLTSIEYRIFDARFLDDGAGHVFLSLIQQNQNTGALTTLMAFDSNASSPSPSYQRAIEEPLGFTTTFK
jgi:hypothetical protein